MDSTGQGGVTEKLDIGGPYSSFVLDEVQIKEYSRLLRQFDAAVQRSNGSEDADEACLKSLIVLDDFIRAVAKDKNIGYSDTLEVLFNQQADGRNLSINDYLQEIVTRKTQALQQAQEQSGREGVQALLKAGGAQIIPTNTVFVKTAPERASIAPGYGEEGHSEVNRYAPKLQEVITALLHAEIGGARIYYDDLVIHKGAVDPKTVRNRPYDVIQIPKIDKEIAVCETLGEAIFVSPKMRGPEVYAAFKKHELEGSLGMRPVIYRGEWQKRLIEELSNNLPPKIEKVNVVDFARRQTNKPMRLSPEIIAIALLKYAAGNEKKKMATAATKDSVPDWPAEKWTAFEKAGAQGHRTLPAGMTIAAVKRYFGWIDKNNKPNEDKYKLDLSNFASTGELPKPAISIEDAVEIEQKSRLSPEIIAELLLKHALAEGKGALATINTETPVPGKENDAWISINSCGTSGDRGLAKGMTLSAIKRLYGWFDRNNKMQAEKLKADLEIYRQTGVLPKPVLSVAQAVEVFDKPDLSIEIVAKALLKYALGKEGNGLLAAQKTKGDVPDLPDESWLGINAMGLRGSRGLNEGMNLPAIKRFYGWFDEDNNLNKLKLENDLAHFAATGELPKPVMTIEAAAKFKEKADLSAEIIAGAMIKYASSHNDKLPNATVKEDIPDLDETWLGIQSAGFYGTRGLAIGLTLAAVKQYYGWIDADNTVNQEKLRKDISHFAATGELPKPVMSIEHAIVVRKKAGQASAPPPPNDPPTTFDHT